MKKKTKIVYLINSLKKGGPVNMLHTLVKYMNKERFHITVVSLRPCPSKLGKDFSDAGCEVVVLHGTNIFKTFKLVKELINKIQPDLVHSHGGIADVVNSRVNGKHKKYSTVHCSPDEDFVMKKGKLLGTIKANSFIHIMKKIEHPIACSETVSKKILEKRHIIIDYVRNGIDIEKVGYSENAKTRKELGIDEEKVVLAFCGYLSKRKNVSLIFDAFEKIDRDDIVLLVLGDGSEYESLQKRADMDQRILMVGRVDNAYEYLQNCDYFISSSLSEGLPLAVMEGMSCGLPAILSDIDSHCEVEKLSPKAVYLFENNNSDDLAKIISNLDLNDYKQKSTMAMELVRTVLSSKAMAEEYELRYMQNI